MNHRQYEKQLIDSLRMKLPRENCPPLQDTWELMPPDEWEKVPKGDTPHEVHSRAIYLNEFRDGRFKFLIHTKRPKDRQEQPVIEDYACDEGRADWPDYVILPDGREGPRPFRNTAELRDYQRLTGLRPKEPGEASINKGAEKKARLRARIKELKARLGQGD